MERSIKIGFTSTHSRQPFIRVARSKTIACQLCTHQPNCQLEPIGSAKMLLLVSWPGSPLFQTAFHLQSHVAVCRATRAAMDIGETPYSQEPRTQGKPADWAQYAEGMMEHTGQPVADHSLADFRATYRAANDIDLLQVPTRLASIFYNGLPCKHHTLGLSRRLRQFSPCNALLYIVFCQLWPQ